MNFKQAIEQLLAGKKIRIASWNKNYYWQINEESFVKDSINNNPLIHKSMLLEQNKWEIKSDQTEINNLKFKLDILNENLELSDQQVIKLMKKISVLEKKRRYWENKYKKLERKKNENNRANK